MGNPFNREFWSSGAFVVLGLFLAADVVLITIHVVVFAIGLQLPPFDIETDHSYPEFFQYLKWFWLFSLSVFLSIRRRELAYIILGPIFLLLLADDSFSIHETQGARIAASLTFEPVAGLRPQDVGELIVDTVTAIFVSAVWFCAYLAAGRSAVPLVKFAGVMIVAVGFFAVILDAAHQALRFLGPVTYFVAGVIEDGGEMVMLTVLLSSFLFAALPAGRQISAPQPDGSQSRRHLVGLLERGTGRSPA